MSAAHLEKLNGEQRRAVEHGVGRADGAIGGPLLIIAGAGSGKTNTLAHRVAHLIVNGADPRRILLMTFSRRAAAEMSRRVERICGAALGGNAGAGAVTDALSWAGTFHGMGARLLRDYAEQIGLDPAFTIHDREDSADLLNLVRHELGFSKMESRFPTKGTCLAIYSRTVNAELPLDDVLRDFYPWCAGWSAQLRELFAAYVEAKQKQNVLGRQRRPASRRVIVVAGRGADEREAPIEPGALDSLVVAKGIVYGEDGSVLGKHQRNPAHKTAGVLNKISLPGFETDERGVLHADAGGGKVRGIYGFLFSASMRD